MEKNPVFELPQASPMNDNQVHDTLVKPVKQQKLPRHVWAYILVAVITILAITMACVAIAGMIVFRPSTSESQAVSGSEVESLKQEVRDLKQLLNQTANSSHPITEIRLHDGAIEDLKANLQRQFINLTEELKQQIDSSLLKIGELQHQFDNSTQTLQEFLQQCSNSTRNIEELQQQVDRSVLKIGKLQHQLNDSTAKLHQQVNSSEQRIIEFQLQQFNSSESVETKIENLKQKLYQLHENLTQDLWQQLNSSVEKKLRNFSDDIRPLQVQLDNLNSSLATGKAIVCDSLSPPDNGRIVVMSGPNSLSHGLGSVATYSCDPGYVLVGYAVRSCGDPNGGTVTMGAWTHTSPACQKIITCPSLTQPNNGAVNISSVEKGGTATYSCNTGYRLVGQATRTCVVSDEGTTGSWSESEPTCQEVITCPSLPQLSNGTITFTPGANNSNVGLGSVATFSCNLGYVLVGQTTRECQSFGITELWSGSPPICEEVIYCPPLTPPDNGSVIISSGVNYLSVGSTATYSCDPGYALLGSTTRTCEDRDSVGTWNEEAPFCQVILCSELSAPGNGIVLISPTSQVLGVGTTATYYCDHGYVLAGDSTRTCEDRSRGTSTVGTWSGIRTSCALPVSSFIDCQSRDCRYDHLVCPELDDCTLYCYDSRSYPCYQSSVFCSSNGGDCTVNCDEPYACLQANIVCPQGTQDCIVNCQNDHTCFGSVVRCSGDSCLINCDTDTSSNSHSCSNSTVTISCSNENCSMNCRQNHSCENSVMSCSSCSVNCEGSSSCRGSMVKCENVCQYNCAGSRSCGQSSFECSNNCIFDCDRYSCQSTNVDCRGDSCLFNCGGLQSCSNLVVNCSSGDCMLNCEDNSCQNSQVVCSPGEQCNVKCTGKYACQSSKVTCPEDGNCTIYCKNHYACQHSQYTCLRGGQCDFVFNATNDLYINSWAGQYATITCESTANCSIQCTSTELSYYYYRYGYACNHMQVTCSNDGCIVQCSGHQACQYLNITCGGDHDCLTCSGSSACYSATITYPSDAVASLPCSGNYSCLRANITCPVNENCSVTCSGYSTCRYLTITCPLDGNCIVNCSSSSTCQYLTIECPVNQVCTVPCSGRLSCQYLTIACGHGKDCLTCSGYYSCSRATITYPSNEIANLNCSGSRSCRYGRITCPENDCTINCINSNTCHNMQITCPDDKDCLLSCAGSSSCTLANVNCTNSDRCTVDCTNTETCERARVTCPEGNDCIVSCTGSSSCTSATVSCVNSEVCAISCAGDSACQSANFTCPLHSPCSFSCTEANACQSATFTCPENKECSINCTDTNTCKSADIICPKDSNCNINCSGQRSCQNAGVTCPTGDYSCDILCTNPLSCLNLIITNTHNVNLQCCGDLSCVGAGVTPTAIECIFQ